MSSDVRHNDRVRAEFTKQAPSFEEPASTFADPRLLAWYRDALPLAPDRLVLEVAAGTGHVSRSIASSVRQAIAYDLTPAMLLTGQAAADDAGIRNVLFQQGDAAELPYLDESFDLVLSRFAIHHFERPADQVAEMARVCRRGGHVAVLDIVAAEDELAASYNEIERLRDPSHTSALSKDALVRLFESHGLVLETSRSHEHHADLERWLAQAHADPRAAEDIARRLRDELAGGPATGMRPAADGGRLLFTQTFVVLVFKRA